jgi:hypothetical protein
MTVTKCIVCGEPLAVTVTVADSLPRRNPVEYARLITCQACTNRQELARAIEARLTITPQQLLVLPDELMIEALKLKGYNVTKG